MPVRDQTARLSMHHVVAIESIDESMDGWEAFLYGVALRHRASAVWFTQIYICTCMRFIALIVDRRCRRGRFSSVHRSRAAF